MKEVPHNPFLVGILFFYFSMLHVALASAWRERNEERRHRETMERNYYRKCEEARQLKKLYNHAEE